MRFVGGRSTEPLPPRRRARPKQGILTTLVCFDSFLHPRKEDANGSMRGRIARNAEISSWTKCAEPNNYENNLTRIPANHSVIRVDLVAGIKKGTDQGSLLPVCHLCSRRVGRWLKRSLSYGLRGHHISLHSRERNFGEPELIEAFDQPLELP